MCLSLIQILTCGLNTHSFQYYQYLSIITMISGPWTSVLHPTNSALPFRESVRSPVLSVICFITRHSSFSSRSKVRSPGGKRHLGGRRTGKSHGAMVKRGTETCWNPLKPYPARDELVIFDDVWIWCNNSKDFSWPCFYMFLYVSILSGFCKLLKLPYPCSHNGNWWLHQSASWIRQSTWWWFVPLDGPAGCLWSAVCSRNAFNVTVFIVHCANIVVVRTYNCKKNRIDQNRYIMKGYEMNKVYTVYTRHLNLNCAVYETKP